MITVVDSPHFFRLYSSKNDVADHEELLGKEEVKPQSFDDVKGKLDDDNYDTMKWVEVERKVVDLLVEQVECADMIVLNKVDRIEDNATLESLHSMVSALNPSASVFEASYGKIPMHEVASLHRPTDPPTDPPTHSPHMQRQASSNAQISGVWESQRAVHQPRRLG